MTSAALMGKDGHSIQAVAGRQRESGDLGPTLDSDTHPVTRVWPHPGSRASGFYHL